MLNESGGGQDGTCPERDERGSVKGATDLGLVDGVDAHDSFWAVEMRSPERTQGANGAGGWLYEGLVVRVDGSSRFGFLKPLR